jgi:hypothetical protein
MPRVSRIMIPILALCAGSCQSPKPGTDVAPAPPFHGTFVSAAVSGQRGGIELRAHLTWHGAVRGEKGGIRLDAMLR